MYSFMLSALSILQPSKFFLVCSFALSLLSSSTMLFSIFHASDEALARTTISATDLSFSTAFVRPFHTVSDCATICLPYSISSSLRDLSPVKITGRLLLSASSDQDDKAHVWNCFRNLDHVLHCAVLDLGHIIFQLRQPIAKCCGSWLGACGSCGSCLWAQPVRRPSCSHSKFGNS